MRPALVLIALILLIPGSVSAQPVPLSGPQASENIASLGDAVMNVFNLALLVSGILAFGAVVYGAFMYTFSAGNPGMQSDARDQITQAFLGLALLLGGYIILNTINPDLTRIQFAALPEVQAPKYEPANLIEDAKIVGSYCTDSDGKYKCTRERKCLNIFCSSNCTEVATETDFKSKCDTGNTLPSEDKVCTDNSQCSNDELCGDVGGYKKCYWAGYDITGKELCGTACVNGKVCVRTGSGAVYACVTGQKRSTAQTKECDENNNTCKDPAPICSTADYKCHPKPVGVGKLCQTQNPSCEKNWQVCQPILNAIQSIGECGSKCRNEQNTTGFICPGEYKCDAASGLCKK